MRSIYQRPSGMSEHAHRSFLLAVDAAIEAARSSPCAKDQRGAAVYHVNYGHLVALPNAPPAPFVCDRSEACQAACGKLAVHAEMAALLKYLASATGFAAQGMDVVHVRTVGGEPVTSGPPSCISCSRDMLAAEVARVWLWHEEGWRSYDAADFHARSLTHEKHRLPVIRV